MVIWHRTWYSYRLRVNCYNCCDIKKGIFVDLQGPTERKEGNVLFNDALNTFYLQLYGVGHVVKDHSEKKAAATTWATVSD